MSGFECLPLADLVLDDRRRGNQDGDEVWNLNLDQIEPDSGRILEKVRVPPNKLGPSTNPFTAGTVLYSKLRPYLNKVVVADEDGVATTELVPLRCNPEKVLPSYLAYFLRSAEFLNFANTVVAGAKMPRMVMSEFWRYPVPTPPLSEQRRIAAILDKADALRAKRREALAQLDHLAQSIFLETFGDPTPTRTPFTTYNLSDVCTKISDGTHHSPPIQKDGVPYITAKHLKRDGLDFFADPWYVSQTEHEHIFARCDPKPGDVLYIKDGATTGIAAVNKYDFPFSMLSSLALIRPNLEKLLPAYLCEWLNQSQVKTEILGAMSGAAIRRLTLSKIKAIRVPVPPLALQREFADRLDSVQNLRATRVNSISVAEKFFATLQFRAFNGEL